MHYLALWGASAHTAQGNRGKQPQGFTNEEGTSVQTAHLPANPAHLIIIRLR